MIMPTKHIPPHDALIGVGATVLRHIEGPITASSRWERVKNKPNVATFERFVLAANLLFLIGAIEMKDGLIVRSKA